MIPIWCFFPASCPKDTSLVCVFFLGKPNLILIRGCLWLSAGSPALSTMPGCEQVLNKHLGGEWWQSHPLSELAGLGGVQVPLCALQEVD